jgi:two-component system sensor histidine kinase VicK
MSSVDTDDHVQSTLAALETVLLDMNSWPQKSPASSGSTPGGAPDLASQAGAMVMIDGIGHDMRSPLTAIILYVEHLLVGAGGPLSDEQSRVLHVVTESTKRLANFINNLLALSQISHGKLECALGKEQIAPLLEDMVKLHEVVAAKKRVTIVKQIQPDLPVVAANRDKIEQVMINAMSNALKFAPEGGQVTISAGAMDAQWIQVWITDNGAGIAEAQMPELFKNYAQLDAEHRVQLVHGTGLGLLVSKEIIDAHGGQIWATSTPGAGATLHFTLAIAPP